MEALMLLRHRVWEVRNQIITKLGEGGGEMADGLLHMLEDFEGKLGAAECELLVPGGVLDEKFEQNIKELLSQLESFFQDAPAGKPIDFSTITLSKGDQTKEDANYFLEKLSRWVNQEYSLIKPLEQEVYGGIDVEQIVQMVLKFDSEEKVLAIPIIGTRSTTVAQRVYHDSRVQCNFDVRHWVCMCEMIHGHSSKLLDLIFRQQTSRVDVRDKFHSIVNGKKYLLILDGITQVDLGFFLSNLLRDVSFGSKIILTTSSKATHGNLKPLSVPNGGPLEETPQQLEKETWTLFESIAFRDEEKESKQILMNIGKEICVKYASVPSLLKKTASLLSSKKTVKEWENFRDNFLTSLPVASGTNPSNFNLSYEQLQSNIQQCVHFCSLFPKDYKFDKTDLIHLWASQEYLSTASGGLVRPAELVGEEYFVKLHNNGYFFENTSKKDGVPNVLSYMMPCIVNEFLKDVAKNQCRLVEQGTTEVCDDANILHVSFTVGRSWEAPPWLHTTKNLRSLLFLPRKLYSPVKVLNLKGGLSNLRSLRALDLAGVNCEWHFLGDLKGLRYLRLGVSSEFLPESITELTNLETLDLRQSNVTNFPRGFHKLSHLRHLYTGGRLTDMPRMFWKLKSIQTLDVFIVGENNGLDVLAGLSDLVGKLIIRYEKHHENDFASKEGYEGILKDMNLTDISLVWSSSYPQEEALNEYDCMKPPPSLKSLAVCRWKGVRFPKFMFEITNSLVSVHIEDCHGCKDLPPFGALPHLKSLQLWDMNILQYVEASGDTNDSSSSHSSSTRQYFPSLEFLMLANLPELEGWSSKNQQQQHPITSHNLTLSVSGCPKMTSMPLLRSLVSLKAHNIHGTLLKHLLSKTAGPSPSASLKKLEIVSVDELNSTLPIRNLNALESLPLRRCPKLNSLILDTLSSLQRLEIHDCSELLDITCEQDQLQLPALETFEIKRCEKLKLINSPGEAWQCFGNIRFLKLTNISNLKSLENGLCFLQKLEGLFLHSVYELRALPEWIGSLKQLHQLVIRNCPYLLTFPESLGNLSALQLLEIHSCPKLKQIPYSFAKLKSLQLLEIKQCHKLSTRCQKRDGEDFPLIQHVADVRLDTISSTAPSIS